MSNMSSSSYGYVRNDFPMQFGRVLPQKRSNRQQSGHEHERINKEVATHCNKVFHFADNSKYVLPSGEEETGKALFSSDKWIVQELLELKRELNAVKSELNNVDLKRWHDHTRRVNYAAAVLKGVKRFKPELFTQAWCKFYDIASNFDLFPDYPSCKTINSLHLCEAPGAFVTSLNHFLRTNHPEAEWNWLATTLNPYYEGNDTHQMIIDDRFILKTLDRWCFGEDSTGDIRKRCNVNHIVQQAAKMGPVHFVTADGSVDCVDDPAEQENRVVSLHYHEVLVALRILQTGGSFVLKLFTVFECDTICLLYLLKCCFERIVARKPIPSKEGNSEIYLICLGYKGSDFSSGVWKRLDQIYEHEFPSKALFSRDVIPDEFIANVIQCARFFTNTQISVIFRNKSYYSGMSRYDTRTINAIQKQIAQNFFETCKLERLGSELYVGKQENYERNLNFTLRVDDGSFEEKTSLKNSSLRHILDHYKRKLADLSCDTAVDRTLEWLKMDGFPSDPNVSCSIIQGKAFKTIKSSPFCPASLIEMLYYLWNLTGTDSSVAVDSSVYDGLEAHLSLESQKVVRCVLTADESFKASLLDYSRFQTVLLNKLIAAVNQLSIHDTLILAGMPLLTQFNVSLVYLLARFFNGISFADPRSYDYCVVFTNLTQPGLAQLLKSMIDANASSSSVILSLVPIQELRFSNIFVPVSKLNAEVLKNVSSRIITILEKSI